MDVGVIDVIDWQTIVDMQDGEQAEIEDPRIDLASELCASHPYPGDLTTEGAHWVTDVALDLNARYAPDYVLLDYASLFLHGVFRSQTAAERDERVREVFAEVERFLDGTEFAPVIVGLGDLMPFRGYIDTLDLQCLVSAAGMNTRGAGLFDPSEADLAKMADREGVARVVSREAFRAEFGGCEAFYEASPDAIAFAEPGYVFHGVNVGSRPLHSVPRPDAHLPLHTPFVGGESLTDVPQLVLEGLREGKVALILVEGVGCETFPMPFRRLSNSLYWYRYTMSPDQYLALTSGLHLVEYPYPPGYRYELYDDVDAPYPFSGIFEYLPKETIGRRYEGRSAAVGNRSILTHLAAGTDIAVECFVRALYNHGVMATVKAEPPSARH